MNLRVYKIVKRLRKAIYYKAGETEFKADYFLSSSKNDELYVMMCMLCVCNVVYTV